MSNEAPLRDSVEVIIYNQVMNRATELCEKYHHRGEISQQQFTSGILLIIEEAKLALKKLVLESLPAEQTKPFRWDDQYYPLTESQKGFNKCLSEVKQRLQKLFGEK